VVRATRIVLEILPRISVLIILTPILININLYAILITRIPLLISRGALDIASYPLLIFVSILSGLLTLVYPSPSILTLTIFFMVLADPRFVLALGIYTVIVIFFIVLISDAIRNIYRKLEGSPVVDIRSALRDTILGSLALFLVTIVSPLIVSLLVASYIFSFKLHTQSPYLAPIVSFLNNNPAGSIVMTSILLAVFYILSRYAIEISILYTMPNPRIALTELSSVANISWIKPSLGFLRGFIVSAIITPPIYYMFRGFLASLAPYPSESMDLVRSVLFSLVGIALFAIIWSIVSRGLFTEEREPGIKGVIYLVTIIALIYTLSMTLDMSPWSSQSQNSLDSFLAPVAQYYKDLWIMAELLIRAMGGAP